MANNVETKPTVRDDGYPYEIHVSPKDLREPTRVLKHGDIFGVFNHFGDIRCDARDEGGLFYRGTRYLSEFSLLIDGYRPLFLNSNVSSDNAQLTVDLMNGDLPRAEKPLLQGWLHFGRDKFLWQDACYERLRVRNYHSEALVLSLSYRFAADYADIFEVRGMQRPRRGERRSPEVTPDCVTLHYLGLDELNRSTRLRFSRRPSALSAEYALFSHELAPAEEITIEVTVSCLQGSESERPCVYADGMRLLTSEIQSLRDRSCEVRTSNVEFDEWVRRSLTDLDMMVSETPYGPYPYGGVPWFSTPFGRDGIVTALECLWANYSLAAGVLKFLAANQARQADSRQDAQPGKILHEMRSGEMAALGEIPFARYYGSVDSTPLFLMLASAYFERTADSALIDSIWPQLESALAWIDDYGDLDHDGFVEYAQMSPNGLLQQGWKDSHDSVFHADGSLARPPIALCEVQGYVYAARLGFARLAEHFGKPALAARQAAMAAELQQRFEAAFWSDDLGTYALALDGEKRQVEVRTSNAGHCLMTGIALPPRAKVVAATLMNEHGYSGWGIRTVARGAARYNPMSYHNGSVWPHDNALIAFGFDRYRLKSQALRVLTGLFDVSKAIDLQRMPELFCGFAQTAGKGPTLYPVACAPQSWAAAAVFLLLQAVLGLHISAPRRTVSFNFPVLPPWLVEVRLRNLRVGDATLDLRLKRHQDDVAINVVRRRGDVEVAIVK